MSSNRKLASYQEKLAQATREARATVLALLATIVVWIVLGFGLSGLNVTVLHTPLWVVGGTLGTWVFAIAVCVFLERCVFADIDLDDVVEQGGAAAIAKESGGAPASAVANASPAIRVDGQGRTLRESEAAHE